MRSAEAIAVEARSLAVDERAALALRLTVSIDEEHVADADDAWAAEVAARIEAVPSGRLARMAEAASAIRVHGVRLTRRWTASRAFDGARR